MIFLHYYDNKNDFNAEYNDTESIQVASFDCSEGRFTFNRQEQQGTYPYYIWTNGTVEMMTPIRRLAVGNYAQVVSGDDYYEITAVQTESHDPKYYEPWVSYTDVEGSSSTINYNQEKVIDFKPTGQYKRANFGVTQDMIDQWVQMAQNDAPLDSYGVKVLSQPLTSVYNGYQEQIQFYAAGSRRVYIGKTADFIQIAEGEGMK